MNGRDAAYIDPDDPSDEPGEMGHDGATNNPPAASGYVCSRCGMTVHQWGATRGWKHAAGGPVRGCGQPPEAVERAQYDADLDAEIDVLHRNGWGIDDARAEILARRRDA